MGIWRGVRCREAAFSGRARVHKGTTLPPAPAVVGRKAPKGIPPTRWKLARLGTFGYLTEETGSLHALRYFVIRTRTWHQARRIYPSTRRDGAAAADDDVYSVESCLSIGVCQLQCTAKGLSCHQQVSVCLHDTRRVTPVLLQSYFPCVLRLYGGEMVGKGW